MKIGIDRPSGAAATATAWILAAAAFCPGTGAAQSGGVFSVTKSTMQGSGGSSAGGKYGVVSSFANPDAGTASGGTFDVDGGYGSGDPYVCIPPTAASAVAATEDRCDLVQISWTDNSADEDGFNVLRDGAFLAATAPDIMVWDDSTAVVGTTYQYAIVATKACANADTSTANPGKRLAFPVAPATPSIATVTEVGDSTDVELNWTDSSADEIHQIITQIIGGGVPAVLDTLAANVETATVRVATASSADLCFTIAAVNCGSAAVSDTVCTSSPAVGAGIAQFVPDVFDLQAVHPNPFRSGTRIVFDVPQAARTAIEVFDVTGRRVTTIGRGQYGPGRHHVDWFGTDAAGRRVASGVYFLRMTAPEFRRVRRLVLLN